MKPSIQVARSALLVAGSIAACRAPAPAPRATNATGPTSATLPEARESTAPRARSVPARRASGAVTIRLASLASAQQIEALDGGGRARTVRRSNGKLHVDGVEQAELLLTAAPDSQVALDGRSYAGNVRVRTDAAGQWLIENEVGLEDYVFGVVAKELGFGDEPREAWRAQAIAARSYALAALEERGSRRADPYLFDGVRDQAYGGVPQPRNAKERASVEALRAAVRSTRGLVLEADGACVDARYHASCGGRTAEGSDVFPELGASCLRSAACLSCAADASVAWSWTASAEQLKELARRLAIGERVNRIAAARVDASRRWIEVEVVGDRSSKRMRFEELRRELGRDKLRSARIVDTWPKQGADITGGLQFRGLGFGHGAGLCQRGARALAREGWSAERILAHYYAGAHIEDRR